MSSALTIVDGKQVIKLGRPLVVALRLQGVLACVHNPAASTCSITPRPYLAYLLHTLKHLQCDVSIIAPGGPGTTDKHVEMFQRQHFSMPFRLMYEGGQLPWIPARRRKQQGSGLSERNMGEDLERIAVAIGSGRDRVVCIDSEINYRFPPLQTLVVEQFVPLTRRQKRQIQHIAQGDDEVARMLASSPELRQRYQLDDVGGRGHRGTTRQNHTLRIAHSIESIEAQTKFLEEERNFAARRSNEGGEDVREGVWGTARSSRVVRRRMEEEARQRLAGEEARLRSKSNSPFVMNSMDLQWNTTTSTKKTKPTPQQQQNEDGKPSGGAATTDALAINLEDYSMVALAEMIAELAASEESVHTYLQSEPLLEKLRVPFHGTAFYLPMENCDHIDQLAWDEIEVCRRAAREEEESVPEVKTTTEHDGFFK